jgi:hypothetical protein
MLHLRTGGVAGRSATGFFKLTAHAWKVPSTGTAIPNTSLMVGGAACDTNGAAYGALPDNAEYDATVHAEQAGYSNFTFEVEVAKAYLQIWRNGSDIAEKTNTVIVGEQIALTCRFDNDIAPITNFQWTVPGNTVSNYVPSTPVSLLHSNLNLTNASIYFYWYRPDSELEVQCTVIAKGVTITAKTKFNVISPSEPITHHR